MGDNKSVNIAIIFIALVLFALLLKTLQFLRPFTIAILLTLLLMPLIRISKQKKIPIWITLVGIVVILVVIIVLLGSLLASESARIGDKLPQYQHQIENSIVFANAQLQQITVAGEPLVMSDFVDIQKVGAVVTGLARSGIQVLGSVFSEIFLAILFLVFLIPSHEIFIQNVIGGMKGARLGNFKSALLEIEASIRDYLVTKTFISVGTAGVSAIILLLFKADFIVILALLIFLLNYIPNIGSFVAVALALLMFAFKFGVGLPFIWLALLLIGVQVLFGNFLEPKIAGDKLKLAPVIIILSLFLWFWIWGIVGMMLAIPLTSIAKIIMSHMKSTKAIAKFMS